MKAQQRKLGEFAQHPEPVGNPVKAAETDQIEQDFNSPWRIGLHGNSIN